MVMIERFGMHARRERRFRVAAAVVVAVGGRVVNPAGSRASITVVIAE